MGQNVWIVKPAASSRGRHIYLLRSPDELKYHSSTSLVSAPRGRKPASLRSQVVQHYIARPFLVGGYKFDMRMWARSRRIACL